LNDEVKKVEFIRSPRNFKSVDVYYEDFSQVKNSEVIAILEKRIKFFSNNSKDIAETK